MPLSKPILGLMTLSKSPFYIKKLDKIAFGIMTQGKMTVYIMTVCIVKHAITLDIMTQYNDNKMTSKQHPARFSESFRVSLRQVSLC